MSLTLDWTVVLTCSNSLFPAFAEKGITSHHRQKWEWLQVEAADPADLSTEI